MTDDSAALSQQSLVDESMLDGAAHDQHMMEEDDDAITKNDAWHVITSYFDEKGLVRQQLDRCATTPRQQPTSEAVAFELGLITCSSHLGVRRVCLCVYVCAQLRRVHPEQDAGGG